MAAQLLDQSFGHSTWSEADYRDSHCNEQVQALACTLSRRL
jgi:hypothetical protein